MTLDIIFLLVEPAVPENVGAAARAMKTMGFEQMRLVRTEAHRSEKAYWLAHGAAEILDSATHFDTFEDSVEDLDLVIGTTSKGRAVKYDYYTPEEVFDIIRAKGDTVRKVGIVFGSEESGLSNAVLERCDVASTIPLAQAFPSLNLGQSVMLYAYALSGFALSEPDPVGSADTDLFSVLKQRVAALLVRTGLPKERNLHKRIMERLAVAGEEDIHLMLSICNRIEAAWENDTAKGP